MTACCRAGLAHNLGESRPTTFLRYSFRAVLQPAPRSRCRSRHTRGGEL